jgi:DNA-3-methyladenine glycosylase I
MTERDVARLIREASIIRNRGKIQAAVDNARAMLSASPSLMELARSSEIARERATRAAGGNFREVYERNLLDVPYRTEAM